MIFAGRPDCGLTELSAAVVDRDNGVGPLVCVNPECDHGTVSFPRMDGHGSTGRHIPVRALTTLLSSQTGNPESPAGRKTDISHRGNKHGGASPPDSFILPLGLTV